jgi:hypothetical protein
MLLISNSYILPLNNPLVFVWCYTVATFAHQVSAAYFLGGEHDVSSTKVDISVRSKSEINRDLRHRL